MYAGHAGAVLDPDIATYYAAGRERDRLAGERLEAVRTWELVERHLPPPPALVLDVGGGAGVYAVPLAAEGYQVRLVDPVALHVEQARAAAAAAGVALDAEVGDVRTLDVPDGSADAVLLLGPLYHLVERRDRVAALARAGRALRPGSVVLAAAITRWASTLDGWCRGFDDDSRFAALASVTRATGQHRNPDAVPRWFTTAYFHHPAELPAEAADAGLEVEAVLAIEGPAALLGDADERLADPARRERLLAILRELEAEPSLLGVSSHLLLVARRADR